MNVHVIVPVLNERENLQRFISSFIIGDFVHILFVDNGSADDSLDIMRSLQREPGNSNLSYISHPPRGYGAAVHAGIMHILDQKVSSHTGTNQQQEQWVAFAAADGQDLVDLNLPKLIQAASFVSNQFVLRSTSSSSHDVETPQQQQQQQQPLLLVVGDRTATPLGRLALTYPQRVGNALACQIISSLWGAAPLLPTTEAMQQKLKFLTDLGPLRLVPLQAFSSTCLNMEDRSFGWTVEMSIKAIQALLTTEEEVPKLILVEVPVTYTHRRAGVTKISGSIRGSFEAGRIILTTVFTHYARRVASAIVDATPPPQEGKDDDDDDDDDDKKEVVTTPMPPQPPVAALLHLSAILLVVGTTVFSANLDATGNALPPQRSGSTTTPLQRFLIGVAACIVGYIIASVIARRNPNAVSATNFWLVAGLTRMLALCTPPDAALPGDDINRYLFEGLLVDTYGVSPMGTAPSAMTKLVTQGDSTFAAAPTIWRDRIFRGVNHPTTSSVYGPLAHLLFASVAAIAPSPLLMRLILTLADVATAWMLERRFGPARALTYAWCPLVLLAVASGGHVDSLMVLFITSAMLACAPGPHPRRRADPHMWPPVCALLGLACAVKWVPVIFAPFAALYSMMAMIAAPASAYGAMLVRAIGERRVRAHCVRRSAMRAACAIGLFVAGPLLAYAALFVWISNGEFAVRPAAVDGAAWVATAHVASFLPALCQGLVGSPHNAVWAVPFIIGGGMLGLHELAWCFRRWRRMLVARGTSMAANERRALERLPLVAEDLLLMLLCCSPVVHFWYFSWGVPLAVINRSTPFAVAGVTACLYFFRYAGPLGASGGDISMSLRLLMYIPILVARALRSRTLHISVLRATPPKKL